MSSRDARWFGRCSLKKNDVWFWSFLSLQFGFLVKKMQIITPGLLLILKVVQLDSSSNNVHGGRYLHADLGIWDPVLAFLAGEIVFDGDKQTWPAQQCAAVRTQFSSEFRQTVYPVFTKFSFSMKFFSMIIPKGISQPMIEPPQKWVSPTAPTERRDTLGKKKLKKKKKKF